MKTFSFFLALAILCVNNYPVEGEPVPYSDLCPNITGIQEFDYTRLTGLWLDVAHTDTLPYMCAYYFHKIVAPNMYDTTFTGKDSDGKPFSLNIGLSFAKYERPNSYCVDVYKGYLHKQKVVLVYTDYDSLTLGYSCDPDGKGNIIENLQIESRNETYDTTKVQKILEQHNLTRLQVFNSYENCPKVQ